MCVYSRDRVQDQESVVLQSHALVNSERTFGRLPGDRISSSAAVLQRPVDLLNTHFGSVVFGLGRRNPAGTPVSKRLPPRKLGMTGPRLGLVRWFLFLLDLLSLLFVALLEMLRLLLVALLYLLSPGFI